MYYFAYLISEKKLFICESKDKDKLTEEKENHLTKTGYGEAEVFLPHQVLSEKLKQLRNFSGDTITGPVYYITKNSVQSSEYIALINSDEKMPYAEE